MGLLLSVLCFLWVKEKFERVVIFSWLVLYLLLGLKYFNVVTCGLHFLVSLILYAALSLFYQGGENV